MGKSFGQAARSAGKSGGGEPIRSSRGSSFGGGRHARPGKPGPWSAPNSRRSLWGGFRADARKTASSGFGGGGKHGAKSSFGSKFFGFKK
jgi:hypothetical protein